MNNNMQNNKKPECPYWPDLLDNQKLRRELERERSKRKDADANAAGLRMIFLFLLIMGTGAFMVVTIHSGMDTETINEYIHLFAAWAALLSASSFAISMADMILCSAIRRYNERKEKKAAQKAKEEDENHV